MTTGISKKSRNWHYQVRVPAFLRSYFKCSIIRKSTGTANQRQAQSMADSLRTDLRRVTQIGKTLRSRDALALEVIEMARKHDIEHLTSNNCVEVARRHIRENFREKGSLYWHWRETETVDDEMIEAMTTSLPSGLDDLPSAAVRAVRAAMVDELMALFQEHVTAEKRAARGLHATDLADTPDTSQAPPNTPQKDQKANGPLFSVVGEQWIKYKAKSIKRATLKEYESTLIAWDLLIGDMPVDAIDTRTLIKWRKRVEQLPSNWRKEHKKGLPYVRIVELDRPKLTDKVIRDKYVKPIQQCLNWAVYEGFIDAPPQMPEVPGKSRGPSAKGKRPPFTDAEAIKIFRELAARKTEICRKREYAKIWVPLIHAYHGERPESICWMKKEDIFCDDETGIWCFHFGAQRHKTEVSDRIIAIHPELLSVGIVQYSESLSGEWLFPDLNPSMERLKSEKKLYQNGVGNWFNGKDRNSVRQKALPGVDKSMYCFRHSVNQKLKDSPLKQVLCDAITGHSGKTVSESVYGGNPAAKVSYDALERYVKYPVSLVEIFGSWRNSCWRKPNVK